MPCLAVSELDPLTAAGILSGLARNAYAVAVEQGMSAFSAFELARAVELAHLNTSMATVEVARNPFQPATAAVREPTAEAA